MVDTPSIRSPSLPIDALPSKLLRDAHQHPPPTPTEVNGDVEDAVADGVVKDNNVATKTMRASFLPWNSVKSRQKNEDNNAPMLLCDGLCRGLSLRT